MVRIPPIVTLCALAALIQGTVTASDDATFEQLLSRLQQTEARLEQLERQKSQPFLNASFGYDEAPLIPPAITDGDSRAAGGDAEESSEPTLDERIKKLEDGWKELDDAWSSFDKAEKKKKADAKKKPTFKINGRIHADFWEFINDDGGVGFFENANNDSGVPIADRGNDPDDRFAFRRIRLEMKGDILDNMLWRTQIDFNKPATAEMKDVYIGFKNLPNNQTFLIGNQKRPIGLDHLNSSRYNVFTERPFVVEAFNEDARRPGICMYGHTDDESFNWRYGAYYLENINTGGATVNDQRQMSLNFRMAGSPWYDESSGGRGYFHWGLAGMFAHADGDDADENQARFRTRPEARSNSRWLNTDRIDGADWYEIVAVESIFNVGALQITGEFQQNWMQRDGFADVSFQGGYVYVSYMLTGEHIPYDRTSSTIGRLEPFENFFLVDRRGGGRAYGMGAWGIAARYSYLDVSDKDILGGVGESATLALNWYWTAYSKVQFNLIYGDIDNRDGATGATEGSYLIAGTRFAIEF